MSNTHGTPDTLYEIQCLGGDLLPALVLSTTYPTVPVPPSMTLAPFATVAYVRESATPARLIYVAQPAASVTVVGADGGYWLAVHKDTHSAVAGWTRQPGTHYLWRASGTEPQAPDGALLVSSLTVAGGAITAISARGAAPGLLAYGDAGGNLAYAPQLRWDQSAARLGIGGTPTQALDVFGATFLRSTLSVGSTLSALAGITNSGVLINVGAIRVGDGAAPGYPLDVNGDVALRAHTGIGALPVPGQFHLNAGLTQLQSLNVLSGSTIGGGLTVQGVVLANSALTVNGVARVNNILAVGMAPSGSYWFEVNGGAHLLAALQVDSALLVYGTTTLQSSLTVAGATVFNSPVGCNAGLYAGWSPQAGYNASFGTLWVQAGARCGDALMGALYLGTVAHPGYILYAEFGDVRFEGNLTCNYLNTGNHITTATNGFKPGGGPWADSSSRTLKRAIAPIQGALALLLTQRGRQFEWDEPQRSAVLPGTRYGLIEDEVTLPQWRHPSPAGVAIAEQGFPALCIEALRELAGRLEALERI